MKITSVGGGGEPVFLAREGRYLYSQLRWGFFCSVFIDKSMSKLTTRGGEGVLYAAFWPKSVPD